MEAEQRHPFFSPVSVVDEIVDVAKFESLTTKCFYR
jgi:hypothetical protein